MRSVGLVSWYPGNRTATICPLNQASFLQPPGKGASLDWLVKRTGTNWAGLTCGLQGLVPNFFVVVSFFSLPVSCHWVDGVSCFCCP